MSQKNTTIVSHPLVQHKLSIMRDISTPTAKFRQLLREISLLLAYEVCGDLETGQVEIQTPLENAIVPKLEGKKLCFNKKPFFFRKDNKVSLLLLFSFFRCKLCSAYHHYCSENIGVFVFSTGLFFRFFNDSKIYVYTLPLFSIFKFLNLIFAKSEIFSI